jgi:hypothetical protein
MEAPAITRHPVRAVPYKKGSLGGYIRGCVYVREIVYGYGSGIQLVHVDFIYGAVVVGARSSIKTERDADMVSVGVARQEYGSLLFAAGGGYVVVSVT